jgi:hypothetical protein
MKNADTAIVGNGVFVHYCHKIRGLMALRIRHPCCPICFQKNPDYTQNKMIHTVTNLLTGSIILTFSDVNIAIKYIQDRPWDTLALGDTGYVK